MGNDNLHLFLSAIEIDTLNTKLAGEISTDFAALGSDGESIVIIVTLKGAIFFAADLIRKLHHALHQLNPLIPPNIKVDFVRLSSYGAGTQSSGQVNIVKDIETTITGQHVLILDEIVDSGRTIAFLIERVTAKKPKSLRVATLLSKPSRREVPVPIDYCGREVLDRFLVGYGLDFNEKYRHLKDIYSID